jgi:hypothetical protein
MEMFGDEFYTRGDELLTEDQITDLNENYTSNPEDEL